jgi:5'-nucleotidase
MRTSRRLLSLAALLASAGCPLWNGSQDDVQSVGSTEVALPLAKATNREAESLSGDAIADAYLAEAIDAGAQAALFNGGSIRCETPSFSANADEGGCAGLSIPPGTIDGQTLTNVLPFELEDHLVVVQLTGSQLKSTLERSVSSLPGTASGWFMQVANLSYSVDCSQPAQVINQNYPSVLSIVTEGSRVTAISVGGAAVDLATDGGVTYGIVTNSFEAEGDDGHVEMALACAAQNCQPFDPAATDYVEIGRYLSENSPLTQESILGGDGGVAVGSRIVLAANCMSQ